MELLVPETITLTPSFSNLCLTSPSINDKTIGEKESVYDCFKKLYSITSAPPALNPVITIKTELAIFFCIMCLLLY